jgi:hypothetical protein
MASWVLGSVDSSEDVKDAPEQMMEGERERIGRSVIGHGDKYVAASGLKAIYLS